MNNTTPAADIVNTNNAVPIAASSPVFPAVDEFGPEFGSEGVTPGSDVVSFFTNPAIS